ncbi:MAG: hypothetical protein AAFX56_15410 [Pseudomonadota bacterium]
MVTKMERITILASADFKEFLTAEAEQERISVSELVQRRCKHPAANEDDNEDNEAELAELVETLQKSVADANVSLNKGIENAKATLRELRSNAAKAQAGDAASEG